MPGRRTVEIPSGIEHAVSEAVARRLEAELGDRGLLLSGDALAAAEDDAERDGARLLALLLRRCYGSGALAVEFENERVAARLEAALAFGAATAHVLAPGGLDPERELICAIFNLGIGLVDGLCDGDPATGAALLDLIRRHDLSGAVEAPRPRTWLRATLPPALAGDPTAAFTADVVEAFFETLHLAYPGDEWLRFRLGVGRRLGEALEAEQQTVARPGSLTVERLVECSRLTSVLPFQIIETLAGGGTAAGTQLGEAMWLIDDLVDLCQDARSGALNAILLRAPTAGDLERLLDSAAIPDAAAEAAGKLHAGVRLAGGTAVPFLFFVQRYAGTAL